jgi:hypothetical protein
VFVPPVFVPPHGAEGLIGEWGIGEKRRGKEEVVRNSSKN